MSFDVIRARVKVTQIPEPPLHMTLYRIIVLDLGVHLFVLERCDVLNLRCQLNSSRRPATYTKAVYGLPFHFTKFLTTQTVRSSVSGYQHRASGGAFVVL